jgi:bacteriorhodopsin
MSIILGVLISLPLAILVLLALPSVRGAIGAVSPQRQMVLSVVLFAVMCFAAATQAHIRGRFLFYDVVALVGAAGLVITRVSRYQKEHNQMKSSKQR